MPNSDLRTITEYDKQGKHYSLAVDEATGQLYRVTPSGRKYKCDEEQAKSNVEGIDDAAAALAEYLEGKGGAGEKQKPDTKRDDAPAKDAMPETRNDADATDADVADIKTKIDDEFTEPLVREIGDGYGNKMSTAQLKQLEDNIKAEADHRINRTIDEFNAARDAIEHEHSANVEKAETAEEVEELNEQRTHDLAKAKNDFVERLEQEKEELIKNAGQFVVREIETASRNAAAAEHDAPVTDTEAQFSVAYHDVAVMPVSDGFQAVTDATDEETFDDAEVDDAFADMVDDVTAGVSDTDDTGKIMVQPKEDVPLVAEHVMSEHVSHAPIVILILLIVAVIVALFLLFVS